MKALLLAAGKGTRLKPLTDDRPKPMLTIGGVPMLERIMTRIAEQTPIREFVLITGYKAEAIQAHFGDGSKWGWQIAYVPQSEPLGVGHALNCGRDELATDSFLMTYGDIMLSPENYGRAVAEYDAASQEIACKGVLGLNWVDDPYLGAAVYVGDDGFVQRIEEKPAQGTATTHWNNAGLLVFSPCIFDYSDKTVPSARGEYELPDAIQALIDAGNPVRTIVVEGEWRDVGTHEDYKAINAEYGVVLE